MTQELVDKIQTRVEARRKEINHAVDRVKASTEKLINIGFLNPDGNVSDKYKDGVISVSEFLETYLPAHSQLNLQGLKPELPKIDSKPETPVYRLMGLRKKIIQ